MTKVPLAPRLMPRVVISDAPPSDAALALRNAAATWMVVGWHRDWYLGQVIDAIGKNWPRTEEELAALRQDAPFLSGELWDYGTKRCPVRALVAAQWPKVSDAMWGADVQALPKFVAVIERLRWRDVGRRSHFTKSDRNFRQRTTYYATKKMAGLEAARKQRESWSRSAWGVVKK